MRRNVLTPSSIGEVAQRYGVTPRALRHYEWIGLITCHRSLDGGRVFDHETLQRVALIAQGRQCGLRLEDIRKLLAMPSGSADQRDAMAALIRKRLAQIENEASTLAKTLAEIEGADVRVGGAVELGDGMSRGLKSRPNIKPLPQGASAAA